MVTPTPGLTIMPSARPRPAEISVKMIIQANVTTPILPAPLPSMPASAEATEVITRQTTDI